MDGILVLNKPVGPTSLDMVRLVKRLTGEKRVGHAGTLDPAASGVLPVLLGSATRASEFLLSAPKTYRGVVRLGIETDTYDAAGAVMREADCSAVTRGQVEQVLKRFQGIVLQKPPMYSALKHKGKPLYKLARKGIEVEREPREVRIDSIALIAWAPPLLTLDVRCGRGTYIRSLAHDLGEALGCGAHLAALERTRVGPFAVEDALTVERLHDAAHGGHLAEEAYALDWTMLDLPAAILSDDEEDAVRSGRAIATDPDASRSDRKDPCRAYGESGVLIGMIAYDANEQRWRPTKIFPREAPAG
ncbi:MAG: tRNA pseudouridine(55) synthase TruB [Chloroflexi bacterium]|nr:tRNA pseudouridine(55) synthase TruB [Chloroflexota bacterium]